jgi:hypothetical protein
MKEKPLAPIDLKDALITIDDCGVLYKGKRLPFGKSLPEWEKALGQKSSRPELGMFDELGVAWQGNSTEPQSDFYIFFTNLDTPEGKAGKLRSARDWKPWSEREKDLRTKSKDPAITTVVSEEEISQIKEDENPRNFFYPFKIYQGVVNVQGAPIKGDMDLQVINAYREQTKKVDIFTFWDRNVNSRDETLTTEGDNGEYFQITDKECDGKLYRIVLLFTNYKLEYMRVSNLSKSDMEMYEELTK